VSALLIIHATVLDREPYRRYQVRASGKQLEVLEGRDCR
jgi:hypothetical protein